MAKCTFQEGAVSPVGVAVPKFIGQLYHDTTNDEYWRSTGLTNADWVFIGVGTPFVEWLPHTEVATWNDAGGIGQVGDYTTFLANADLSTISSINLNGTAITSLVCNNCQLLTNIEAGNCTGPLSILDVSGCISLSTLTCYYNSIGTLDVSDCHALSILLCSYNLLTTLNVSGCSALTNLTCDNNLLNALDVSTCVSLTTLNFRYNSIAAINVSNCTDLINLVCGNNVLLSLDTSTCPSLVNLLCFSNSLTSLIVTGCSLITTLDCGYNSLTTIDASTCTALVTFDCRYNLLTTLNVLGCVNLNILFCFNNSLTNGAGGSVNVVLSDMVTNSPPPGNILINNQTPLAPPDAGPPDGATAKATLIGLGWVVTTD